MPPFFLNTEAREGYGAVWDFDAPVLQVPLPFNAACSLCGLPTCADPIRYKAYADSVWYLQLGTLTRYADVAGRSTSYRNAVCFHGDDAIIHLGSGHFPRDPESRFLLIDRADIHIVLRELHHARNTICVDKCGRGADVSSYRAMWSTRPSNGGSRLFHRWLLHRETSRHRDSAASCVEHLNDVPLDCRRANLRASPNRAENSAAVHRLAAAFRAGRLYRVAAALQRARDRYLNVVVALRPLPDCVFQFKPVPDASMASRFARHDEGLGSESSSSEGDGFAIEDIIDA